MPDIQELIQLKDAQRSEHNYISFTENELLSLSRETAQDLIEYFHGYTLILLPKRETDFFEWLKLEDNATWNDLWQDGEDLYKVSVDLLSVLAGESGVFPICDLIDVPNYWFSPKHIKPEGMEAISGFLESENLNMEQQFLLQLSTGPLDIWHFCYTFSFSVIEMKKAIDEMVFKGWIVHLPDRADLVKYLEI